MSFNFNILTFIKLLIAYQNKLIETFKDGKKPHVLLLLILIDILYSTKLFKLK